MDADGANQRRLTRDTGKHSHPSWSPNGTRLVYASTLTGHNQVWRIRADGVGAEEPVEQHPSGNDPDLELTGVGIAWLAIARVALVGGLIFGTTFGRNLRPESSELRKEGTRMFAQAAGISVLAGSLCLAGAVYSFDRARVVWSVHPPESSVSGRVAGFVLTAAGIMLLGAAGAAVATVIRWHDR